MSDPRDNINFMVTVADLGIIASGATAHANLESLKNEFGKNFNTILITNNSTEELSCKLDGRTVTFIKGNGTVFGMDWEDNIQFHDVQIKNEDGVNATAANEIRISIGKTGAKNAK